MKLLYFVVIKNNKIENYMICIKYVRVMFACHVKCIDLHMVCQYGQLQSNFIHRIRFKFPPLIIIQNFHTYWGSPFDKYGLLKPTICYSILRIIGSFFRMRGNVSQNCKHVLILICHLCSLEFEALTVLDYLKDRRKNYTFRIRSWHLPSISIYAFWNLLRFSRTDSLERLSPLLGQLML